MNDAHRLMLLPTAFTDWTDPTPLSEIEVAAQYSDDGWNKTFYNDGSFTHSIAPTYNVAGSQGCQATDGSWRGAAWIAAQALGYHGDLVMLLGPAGPDCGYRSNAGYLHMPLAALGGTMLHERGHLLNLPHDGTFHCQVGVPCDLAAEYLKRFESSDEYSGIDFMSAGNSPTFGPLCAHHMRQLGLIAQPVEIVVGQTVTLPDIESGRSAYAVLLMRGKAWGILIAWRPRLGVFEAGAVGSYPPPNHETAWGSDPHHFYSFGQKYRFKPGETHVDATDKLPPVTLSFLSGGKVSVK